jgi:DNA-binding MarR family transcriptional regulator
MPRPTRSRADDATEDDGDARRIGAAWRELRRLAAAQAMRKRLYGAEPPLDQGQGDALEYIASHGPCRMGDLARYMRVDPSSATRAVERLEVSGLVVRIPDPGDARAVQVSGTVEGLALYAEVRARALELLGRALDGFTAAERDALAGLMERLVVALEAATGHVR